MPTLVHSVSRNDNTRSRRRIRQRGKALSSHTRFPLLTEREECEYLTSSSLSTFDGIINLSNTMLLFEIKILWNKDKLRVYDNGWPFEAFDMAFNTAASLLQRLAAQVNISHMIIFYLNGVLHGGKRLNFGQRPDFRIPTFSDFRDGM